MEKGTYRIHLESLADPDHLTAIVALDAFGQLDSEQPRSQPFKAPPHNSSRTPSTWN
jgi:hypothetical protein